ncbi:MAG: sulfatase [Cyclobacteriaceae bacterium]
MNAYFHRKLPLRILLPLLGLLFGCASEPTANQPNLVLFLADDLSYFDLGVTANTAVQTPHVDAFSAQSTSFMNMYTPTAMCAPSRSALYTGLYPHRNGCHYNHGSVYDTIRSLPHYLSELGYKVFLVGKRHIKPQSAFPFEYYPQASLDSLMTAQRNQPFCLIYASDEPHGPHVVGNVSPQNVFLPPRWVDTPETRQHLADYYGDVQLMDEEFGQLVNSLQENELYDNALVIFTSDHGYEYFSKWTTYNTGLKVPFYLKMPAQLESTLPVNALTSFVDITPTFVELAGGSPDAVFNGKSLVALLNEETDNHHQYLYGSHTNRGILSGQLYPVRSVQNDEFRYIVNLAPDSIFQNINTHGRTYDTAQASPVWKSWLHKAQSDSLAHQKTQSLLRRPEEELYRIVDDEFEQENLASDPQYASVKRQLRQELLAWMEQQGDNGIASELKVPLKYDQ